MAAQTRSRNPHQPRERSRDAGYVIARAIGYAMIWLGWLLFAASVVAVTLARYL